MSGVTVEEWGPGEGSDSRTADAWQGVRTRIGYATPDEPVPAGGTCLLARRGADAVARCSLGRSRFTGETRPTGWIGNYEATDAEAGVELLNRAVQLLHERGMERVLGPLNGSTWHRYRFALRPTEDADAAEAAPFGGEPWNPPEYPEQWRAAGFTTVAEYESRAVTLPPGVAASADAQAALRERGIRVRGLRSEEWDEELDALHALSAEAFRDNPFYAPIDLFAFRELYAPLRPLLDPALVRVAEDERGPVGFVLAYPDPLTPGDARGRIVLKSLASAPRARGLGLGGLLVAQVHAAAAARGAATVVHALMHLTNPSVRISAASGGEPLRRYVLFGRTTAEGAA